jgi:hypothetical protein
VVNFIRWLPLLHSAGLFPDLNSVATLMSSLFIPKSRNYRATGMFTHGWFHRQFGHADRQIDYAAFESWFGLAYV